MGIGERIKQIVVTEDVRLGELEKLSGINKSSWNNSMNERQRPTEEMIQFVAREWPKYAFWLVTGTKEINFEGKHTEPKIRYLDIGIIIKKDDDEALKNIVKKEPVDWNANDHLEILEWHKYLTNLKEPKKRNLEVIRMAIEFGIQAREEKKLIRQVIKEKEDKQPRDENLLASLEKVKKFLMDLRENVKKD